MHSTRRIFLCFLILNLNGIQIFEDSFVLAVGNSPFSDGKNIIGDPLGWIKNKKPTDNFLDFANSIAEESHRIKSSAPEYPSSWLTKFIRTAITVTSKFSKIPKPLTFFGAMDETCLVNQTDNSLQITILNSVTVSTLTGGMLGNDLFECHSYSFAWNVHLCNSSHIFEAHIEYKNTNYATFEEALQHPDGVLVVVVPIETSGDFGNSKFNSYGSFLKTKMKGPGFSATVQSDLTYLWFANFPFDGIYTTYNTKYQDQVSGQTGVATAIVLPYDPQSNYLSGTQFSSVFVNMWDQSGQMSQDFEKLTPEERHKGVCVINLPA